MDPKTALIVGTGPGLSASLARLFCKHGLQVAMASREPDKLAKLARADQYFIDRNLYPNVDYYSAIVLYTLNLDVDMFTPLFAMSRMAGWTAHIIEQVTDNRLIRPSVDYVGKMDLPWTPIDKR